MTADPNAVRAALARRVSDEFSRLDGFRASILTGSAALGLADFASDLDVALFFDAVPSREALEKTRISLGGNRLLFAFGEPSEGDFIQSFLLDGIKTDVGCVALSRWERDSADVLERHNVDSPFQKVLSGLLDSVSLAGEQVIDELRRNAAYPERLAAAVVRKHLRFYPPWALRAQAADRDDAVYFHELLTGEVGHLLNVLCGLNRIYHCGETKRSDHLLSRMTLAPGGIRAALPRLYGTGMADAADCLDGLIRATFDLVEANMPEVDVAAARRRYATPMAG